MTAIVKPSLRYMRVRVDTIAPRNAGSATRVPAGSVVYAVGDIHGRLDLLTALEAEIIRDSAKRAAGQRVIVYLGDYVDRGPASAAVIDHLLDHPLPGFDRIYLLGNHERVMLDFLLTTEVGPMWLKNGAIETLASYGIQADARTAASRLELHALQGELRERLPPRHIEFLEGLKPMHVEGDYAFVHAGVRPGTPLASQDKADLIWIREPFLSSTVDHGKIVVHGHTIKPEPVVTASRIGIDTGAYSSGRLTALGLEDNARILLHTVGGVGWGEVRQ